MLPKNVGVGEQMIKMSIFNTQLKVFDSIKEV